MPLRFDLRAAVAAAASILALAALFAWFPYTLGHSFRWKSVLSETWWLWWANSDWQHGMLVPPLAGLLVYLRRRRLAALPVRGSAWGLAVLALAAGFYLSGYLTDIPYAGDFALNLFVVGLVLWYLGPAWLKELAFPCLFLLFMWPMPFLDNLIALPLRMRMAQGAHLVLSCLGIATERSGTAILSAPAYVGQPPGARFAIDIADPCSGLHSLFALLMVSALYAHLTLDTAWKKWALFLSAAPLAMIGNIARIVLLTLATLAFGSRFAIGTEENPSGFHMAAGFFVFAVALGGMVGVGYLLHRTPDARGQADPGPEPEPGAAPLPGAPQPASPSQRSRRRHRSDAY